MKLKLRGHHLLCLKGFQGYGYDESFVENMILINSERKLPQTTVSICECADDICSSCPNLVDGICEDKTQNERIVSMDREVLKKLNGTKECNSIELFEKKKVFPKSVLIVSGAKNAYFIKNYQITDRYKYYIINIY